jgi:glycosyltransferase involved in cell wall biosynthesis
MGKDGELPRVSFVIPTFNNARTIDRCLRSLADQNYPDMEIVIVDGGSSDSTLETCSRYGARILFEEGTLGKARQVGIRNSTGKILAIFDSDIILPTSSWLQKAVYPFIRNEDVGVVWPVNRPPRDASIVSRCYFGFWNSRFQERKEVLPGGNSLFSRRAIESVGGFNTKLHFGEDFDLTYRILCRGYRVVRLDFPIIHDSMHTLKQFTRKQIWGASFLLTKQSDKKTDLFLKCTTWEVAEHTNPSTGTLVEGVFMSQILGGLRAMITGISVNREFCLMILPLLLGIRIGVYGIAFVRNSVKIRRVQLPKDVKQRDHAHQGA